MIGDMVEMVSKEILDWLKEQPAVKEESITDSLLYKISKSTKLIKYIAFPRNEESKKTGADWEWWFHFTKTAIRFRVQAKKINVSRKNCKGSITYKGNTYNQYKKLIADSYATNSIPVYALYSSVKSSLQCGKNKNDEGVYIAGATQIETCARMNKAKTEDLLLMSIPLSCLFKCPLVNDDYSHFVESYFGLELIKMKSNNISSPGIYQKIPDEVLNILRQETQDSETNYCDKYSVNAIVYVDMRRKNEDKSSNI